MPTRRRLVWTAALVAAFVGSFSAVGASDLPVVFVGIPPQKFVVEQLAGRQVRVEVMLPPGASPATYEPTPRQMAALNGALIYFQVGVPFEDSVLSKVSRLMPRLEVVDCREGVTLVPMEGSDHGHGHDPLDPHFWLDPTAMEKLVETTARVLRETIPGTADDIEASLPRLISALKATDQQIAVELQPFIGRDILVFHPAYGYFTRRYGLVQIAIETEGKTPTARQLGKIVDGLSDRKTPAIVVQPQFSETAARRIADALGCELITLDPLAEDYLVNLEHMANEIAASMVN